MLKRNTLIYMVILVICLIFTGCAAKSNIGDINYSEDWQNLFDGIELGSNFKEINVSTDVFSIYIQPSPDEHTHIRLDSTATEEIKKNFHFELKETNDRLEVGIKGKGKVVNSDILKWGKVWKAELHIQLPTYEYTKVHIKSNVGKINYHEVDTVQLEVNNDVGEIVVRDTNTGKANIKGSVGSIKIHNVGGKMDVKNSTGLIQMNVKKIQDDIFAKTDVGAVTIELEQKPEHIKLDLSTEIGSVNSNLDVEYDKKTKNTIKGHKGNNGPEIKVKTEIGKIEVNHN